MAFYQRFHLILHEIDRFGCFMLKSGFFSKSLVLCLRKCMEIRLKNLYVDIWALGVKQMNARPTNQTFIIPWCILSFRT